MDILFSPYGVGAMPKSVEDEIEQRAEHLLRSSSFQQMLELEKKYKTERLQGAQLHLPASPTVTGVNDTPPSQQHQYADSLAQQQKSLMIKTTRGNAPLPLLSITIPQKEKEDDVEAVTPTNSDSFHKQVKFLAPYENDEHDNEDAMSEQSSICQSPSWENYGQKKKDKKLEAERRKKERAQADKEAKAAKKRSSSRLSKLQPSTTTPSRNYKVASTLVYPERSMSDPTFITQHLTHHRQEDVGRAASADHLQEQDARYPLAVSEVFSNADSRLPLRRSMSEGPMLPHQTIAPSHVSNPCPPSASRTPMLRHLSPSRHSRSSSGNILQTTGSSHSQEPLTSISAANSGPRDGYVRYQRAQSTERALAGLADEELLANPNSHAGSVAPPRNAWPVRRSSLTQDARLAAMKLVGGRTTPATKDNRLSTQGDYFAFSSHPYSSCNADTPAPIAVERLPKTSQKINTPQESTPERPHTAQSSASFGAQSSAGSITSNQSKKSRSLKEAAKAVLSISNGPKSPSAVSLPPYYALRARMQSRPTVYSEVIKSSSLDTSVPQLATASETTSDISSSGIVKSPEIINQAGSRVSEGSSSSSACEDGSPLPSPTTTPDTSRPQSVKDMPFAETELSKATPGAGEVQDDQRTLRESLDSSNSTTPRLEHTMAPEPTQVADEDRWSRTALPVDIDCDAQSFMTSFPKLEDVNNAAKATPESANGPRVDSKSSQELRDTIAQTDLVISIPPRSKRRTQSVTSATEISHLAQEHAVTQEKTMSRGGKANRKQKRQSRVQEQEESVSSSSSTVISSGSVSPTGGFPTLSADFQIPSNPYLEDYPEATIQSRPHQGIESSSAFATTSSVSLPSSRTHSVSSKPLAPPRTNSAPVLSSAASGAPGRPVKLAPVSILKQPKNPTDGPSPPLSPGRAPPVLSALPKHMQQFSARQPPVPAAPTGAAPLAKMFVECCSCKFYHDMPSKIYECMAKPDAVVEDRTLGISGAITTMVKCPWCNHNMSMSCCSGYAAVVYLKEKLH
ncbi:hypothetical protein QBC43DRAFT_333284 [Cladorrhinum sp. PSN259]|nr:hypothetical protein QBC43DRAFT_333284 [Cladorrhinum sp. PSN259]